MENTCPKTYTSSYNFKSFFLSGDFFLFVQEFCQDEENLSQKFRPLKACSNSTAVVAYVMYA